MRETERSGGQTTRPSVLSFGSPSAVTSRRRELVLPLLVALLVLGEERKLRASGEIVTSPVRVRGMQSSLRQRSVVV